MVLLVIKIIQKRPYKQKAKIRVTFEKQSNFFQK